MRLVRFSRRVGCPSLAAGLLAALLALALLWASPAGGQQEPPGPPPHADQPVTLDDRFAEVARRAPVFGGAFIEGDVLNVWLTAPAQRGPAEQAFAAVFGQDRIPPGGVRVLHAQYGFLQLQRWHEQAFALFDIEDVVFTDIDERINRLTIGVTNAATFGVVEQELVRLGIPLAAVNLEVTEPIVRLEGHTVRDRIRPLQGGTQIEFVDFPFLAACTLGFNAVRDGVPGFVTNSHCTEEQGTVTGTEHYQPTAVANNLAGIETVDPPYTNALCPEGSSGGTSCRYSDSAFSALSEGVFGDLGLIARPDDVNTGSLAIDPQSPTFNVVSAGTSFVGEEDVSKVGRTTGWSRGEVIGTCQHVAVAGPGNIVLVCQNRVQAAVDSGDSGSPVFRVLDDGASEVELRGILWGGSLAGGSFVYSPITNVQMESELGPLTVMEGGVAITLDTDGVITFGVQPAGATVVSEFETVRVTNGPADLSLRTTLFTDGADSTWALGTEPGEDTVVWAFSSDGGASWTRFTEADSLVALAEGVVSGATVDILFRLTMPTSTASTAEHSVTVTIVAMEPGP
jgi:hypothetical protein